MNMIDNNACLKLYKYIQIIQSLYGKWKQWYTQILRPYAYSFSVNGIHFTEQLRYLCLIILDISYCL